MDLGTVPWTLQWPARVAPPLAPDSQASCPALSSPWVGTAPGRVTKTQGLQLKGPWHSLSRRDMGSAHHASLRSASSLLPPGDSVPHL